MKNLDVCQALLVEIADLLELGGDRFGVVKVLFATAACIPTTRVERNWFAY